MMKSTIGLESLGPCFCIARLALLPHDRIPF